MVAITALLLGMLPLTSTSPLSRKAVIDSCLAAAGVPYNEKDSAQWTLDSAPFNVRIPLVPIALAVPPTTEHIQSAVRCGRDNGVMVTPKRGGHSYANFDAPARATNFLAALQ